ncbi:MAG: 50S ribosomal protein L4, partial [Thermoplasmatota archaeon]
MARLSALSATADPDVVRNRGHLFDDDLSLPLVVQDDIEQIGRTSEVMEALDSLGVGDDLDRAKVGKKVRAGRGKMRGRKFRRPLSLLIVVSDPNAPLRRAAANLPGVEAVPVNMLNTGLLAPGGDPGRLLLVSESAFEEIGGW